MGTPVLIRVSSSTIMKFLAILSLITLAFGAPMPEGEEAAAVEAAAVEAVAVEEAPVAVPYSHDATGEVAEAYVHEDIPAEAYVHEEIAAEEYAHDATGEVAEAYVHEDIAAEAYTHVEPVVAPVTYAHYPYLAPSAYAGVYAGHPVTYAAYPYTYPIYHTGCLNNVGSVVPCA